MQDNQTEQPTNIPEGWYPDTNVQGVSRYWDGTSWTQHTQVSPYSVNQQGTNHSIRSKKKSGRKIWLTFLVAPIPMLLTTLIIQIIVRFLANGPGIITNFANIISILIGTISVLLIIGSPIWIIMLIVSSKKSKNN